MTLVKITKDGDELTRHGFISGLEDYIKQLLMDPKKASISKYLMSHGINNEELLPLLLKRSSDDENSAIILRKETIKTDPETGKDRFTIKYMFPRENAYKKMRHLYTDLFENYQTNYNLLNEDGECGDGATSADASGQFSQPLFGPIVKQQNLYSPTYNKKNKKKNGILMPDMLTEKDMKIQLTEADINKMVYEVLKKVMANNVINEDGVESTSMGGGFEFGYNAPASICKKNDPALKRHNGKGGSISVNTINEVNVLNPVAAVQGAGKFLKGVAKAAVSPLAAMTSCSSDYDPEGFIQPVNGKRYPIVGKWVEQSCNHEHYGCFKLGVAKSKYDSYWHDKDGGSCNDPSTCTWDCTVTVYVNSQSVFDRYNIGDMYPYHKSDYASSVTTKSSGNSGGSTVYSNGKTPCCEITNKFTQNNVYYLKGTLLCNVPSLSLEYGTTMYMGYSEGHKGIWDKFQVGQEITADEWVTSINEVTPI